jgi:hypothetical protein
MYRKNTFSLMSGKRSKLLSFYSYRVPRKCVYKKKFYAVKSREQRKGWYSCPTAFSELQKELGSLLPINADHSGREV